MNNPPRRFSSESSDVNRSGSVASDSTLPELFPTAQNLRYSFDENADITKSYSIQSDSHEDFPHQHEELDSEFIIEEGREYLRICDHNLQSVLSHSKETWGDILYGTFSSQSTPGTGVDSDIPTAFTPHPKYATVSENAIKLFHEKYHDALLEYQKNHHNSIDQLLASRNIPSVALADEEVMKCFQMVPKVFFRMDYDLTQPGDFENIILNKSTGSQDQLAAYLDMVELSLLKQISSRSDKFFEACTAQDDLNNRVAEACDQVSQLREIMARLKSSFVEKSLKITQLQRKRTRMRHIQSYISIMKEVQHSESSIQAFLQTEDYLSAVDVIYRAKGYFENELEGVGCMAPIRSKIEDYEHLIRNQLSSRFIAVIVSSEWHFDIEAAVDHEKEQEQAHDRLRQAMTPILETLIITMKSSMKDVLQKYKTSLTEEIKIVVKTVIFESMDADMNLDQEDGEDMMKHRADTKVTDHLRALSSEEFLSALQLVFEHLLLVLRRAMIVHNILVNFIPPTTTEKVEVDPELVKYSDVVICKVCEFAQKSISNLFHIRKNNVQHIYTLSQLRTLYVATMEFVQNLETLTTKTDYTLRSVLFSQLKLFLEQYHHTQMSKLVSTLNHELWKTTEVSAARQYALSRFYGDGKSSETIEVPDQLSGDKSSNVLSNEFPGRPSKTMQLQREGGGKVYRVVWSVLLTIEIVINYFVCVHHFPVLASDALQRSAEILRLFNSRTTQLVLGAGAIQVAQLRSISARHLALASLSLELISDLIPSMKRYLESHLPTKQCVLLSEFDRVKQDYVEHHSKIYSKLITIVEDLMKKCCSRVKDSVQYDSESQNIPSKPMKDLVDKTSKLHGVLYPILPPERLQELFGNILVMFSREIPRAFFQDGGVQQVNITVTTDKGKQRVVQDIQSFAKHLRELKGIELPPTSELETKFEAHFMNPST